MSTMAVRDIKVGKRIRKDMGDIEGFAESIKELGYLLNPITVDQNGKLWPGHGGLRLASCSGGKRFP
jgi:hypothetical protein